MVQIKDAGSLLVVAVLLLVAGGCSAGNQDVEGSLDPVVGVGASVTSLPTASLPAGAGSDAADVEAAYTLYVSCLEEAGFHGTLRFDLSLSASFMQDIDIGSDSEAGNRRLDACLEPFAAVLDAYDQTHPQTPSQSETIRERFLACGELYFPRQIASNGSYDEVILNYNELSLAAKDISAALDCADNAMAGPPRPFGR